MKLKINCQNIDGSNDVIAYVDHRLSFSFSNWREMIDALSISIADINGPRSGIDKQCRVVAIASGLEPVVVTERRQNVRHAIDRALARASRTLNSRVKRRQRQYKKPLSKRAVALSQAAAGSGGDNDIRMTGDQ